MRAATRWWRAALVAGGLGLTAGCSSPAPVEIDDIELPPGVENYEGAEEVPIDFLLSQVIETLPEGADLDYRVYYPAGATTDVNQWLSGAVARAGFEESDGDVVAVESRWHRGDQTLTWAIVPFVSDSGAVTDLLVIMTTTRS